MSGFGTVTREGIDVRLNDTRVVDFKLDPRVTQDVTVTANAPPINVTNGRGQGIAHRRADHGQAVARARAASCRWPRRSPASRTIRPAARTIRRPRPARRSTSTAPARAARRFRSTASTTTTRPRTRTGRARRSSTIQEFQVLKNGYSAEFGRGDGAVVLVQTKSGTNQAARRCLSVPAEWRLERANRSSRRRRRSRSGTASQYGVHPRLPDHPEHALRVRQRRSHASRTARTPTPGTSFCRRRSTARG